MRLPIEAIHARPFIPGIAGLGACSQADPNAGTASSINCSAVCANTWPFAEMFQTCWPCANVCPVGTCWDTTNLICSPNPATTNQTTPASQNDAAPPPPVDCTTVLNQLTNSQCGATSWPLIVGGIIVLAVIGAVAANKLL